VENCYLFCFSKPDYIFSAAAFYEFALKSMDLKTPVAKLNFIGTAYEKRLKKLEIKTIYDLIYHFPFRYEDYSQFTLIAQSTFDQSVCLQGEILAIQNIYTKNRKHLTKAVVADSSGQIEVVWFNQPFLSKTLKAGYRVNLAGKTELFNHQKVLLSPEYEILKDKETIHTGRIVPIYPETYGISSKWLRSRIAPLLKSAILQIEDFLPQDILQKYELLALEKALCQIHFPENLTLAKKARERLAFDELFLLQLANLKRRLEWQSFKLKTPFLINQDDVLQFISSLPFNLTQAQKRCIKEILGDLEKPTPMNRLLEGDVGSGKTVVAACAVFIAFKNGFQSAFMAPTEILAEQHFNNLNQILGLLGMKIVLLTGSKKPKNKDPFDLVVGTHALISKKSSFENLSLVVIDEQHRFGVEQRALLSEKGNTPHVLTMTATPIPRTLALTLYGDLDLSVLDEMPEGRLKVKTFVVPPQKSAAAYVWIEKQIRESNFKQQAFVICPFIEESESMQTVKAATVEFEKLQKTIFPGLLLGLLHGKLKSKEKNATLERFRQQKNHILVATPVVEVGIDVPSATIIVVEGADRFGLAQLHQLRGRVGRGKIQSYCFLFSESRSYHTIKRLKAMETENSGIKLAEIDLRLRGPGEIFGAKQHGIPSLKVAALNDLELIHKTKLAASEIFQKDPLLVQNPGISDKLNTTIVQIQQPN